MIYRLLSKQARLRPNAIAITGEQSYLTYRQLLEEVQKKATFLQSINLKAGDSILAGMPPSPEFYVLFYAACAIGSTIIPTLGSENIPASTLQAAPALAVGEEVFLREVKKRFGHLKGTVRWDRNNGLGLPDPPGSFKQKKLISKERVLAVSSSGTTGMPSLHFRAADVLIESAKLRVPIFGIGAEDVLLATRPFNNGSSITNCVMLPLVVGCRVVVREKFQRFATFAAIAQEKVTVLFGVPFIFEILASLPATANANVSSLRLCVSAGAPLSRSVWQRFYQRFGMPIQQVYTGSHIHPAFTYSSAGLPGVAGHVSGPFPIAILNERKKALGPDHVGEVAFHYSKIPRTWKKHFKDNPNRVGRYIHSGDLGKTDQDGNLYILGRKNPFIKVGGNRVLPAEVEDALRLHPQVSDAVAYSLNPGEPNEAVGALVVTDGKLTKEKILRHCARLLDAYKCPRKIEFRKSLPRNPHGKIIRHVFAAETNAKDKAL